MVWVPGIADELARDLLLWRPRRRSVAYETCTRGVALAYLEYGSHAQSMAGREGRLHNPHGQECIPMKWLRTLFRSSLLCRHDILSFVKQRLQFFSNFGQRNKKNSHVRNLEAFVKPSRSAVQVAEVMFFTDAWLERWVGGDPNL